MATGVTLGVMLCYYACWMCATQASVPRVSMPGSTPASSRSAPGLPRAFPISDLTSLTTPFTKEVSPAENSDSSGRHLGKDNNKLAGRGKMVPVSPVTRDSGCPDGAGDLVSSSNTAVLPPRGAPAGVVASVGAGPSLSSPVSGGIVGCGVLHEGNYLAIPSRRSSSSSSKNQTYGRTSVAITRVVVVAAATRISDTSHAETTPRNSHISSSKFSTTARLYNGNLIRQNTQSSNNNNRNNNNRNNNNNHQSNNDDNSNNNRQAATTTVHVDSHHRKEYGDGPLDDEEEERHPDDKADDEGEEEKADDRKEFFRALSVATTTTSTTASRRWSRLQTRTTGATPPSYTAPPPSNTTQSGNDVEGLLGEEVVLALAVVVVGVIMAAGLMYCLRCCRRRWQRSRPDDSDREVILFESQV